MNTTTTFRNMTVEHLGSDATDDDLVDFVAACERVEESLGSEAAATDFVWNDGWIRFNADTCIYCDHPIPDRTDIPDVDDDAAWAELAVHHVDDCEWIVTRSHRR